MLRSVPSEVILRPGLGRLSQPVQVKHHLVHDYGILRDFVCSHFIIELNQSLQTARHSQRFCEHRVLLYYCQIICRIAGLRALPINHRYRAIFPILAQ
jgi:hypothetical protein